MDHIQKGIIAEAMFLVEAAKRRWAVAKPYDYGAPYDFVMRRPDEGWVTVQVKQAYGDRSGKRQPNRSVCLRRQYGTTKRPYVSGDFDWLFVVDGACRWLVPWDAISGLRSTIAISSPKYACYKLR